MASKYWIKLYHEILDDPKMGRLDDALFRRAIECFLAAGDLGQAGALPPASDLAWRLRMDEETMTAQLKELAAAGILRQEADGGWTVANFEKRQKPSSSAERMRRKRERERHPKFLCDENCDEVVTNRHTDIEADGDAEAEEKEMEKQTRTGSDPNEPVDDLSTLFVTQTGIPLHTGGEAAWRNALKRMRKAGVSTADLGEALRVCHQKGLTIASLGSVVTPAIIEMSKRKGRQQARDRPQDDYRKYLKGEYGGFGVAG